MEKLFNSLVADQIFTDECLKIVEKFKKCYFERILSGLVDEVVPPWKDSEVVNPIGQLEQLLSASKQFQSYNSIIASKVHQWIIDYPKESFIDMLSVMLRINFKCKPYNLNAEEVQTIERLLQMIKGV